MDKSQATDKIAGLINRKPQVVISALRNAGFPIDNKASDKEIVSATTTALYKSKEFRKAIDAKLSSPKHSNTAGAIAGAVSGVANLFGEIVGKIGAGKEREHEMALAQQQTQAQLLAALANKKKESNLVPVIVIGGVFVIAAIVLVITLKPKK